MLEWELIEQEDQKMQLVSTLQSTASGRDNYAALCQRQLHLRELVRMQMFEFRHQGLILIIACTKNLNFNPKNACNGWISHIHSSWE
jgi:hypothetical protein